MFKSFPHGVKIDPALVLSSYVYMENFETPLKPQFPKVCYFLCNTVHRSSTKLCLNPTPEVEIDPPCILVFFDVYIENCRTFQIWNRKAQRFDVCDVKS